ncbi:hypothetical protein [Hymenobacter perfusus]|uniref:Lipocalin-like domain-containing protein n=1 Tax=Hymenobacter perfusus TaxID=1236770 RepID=A0A3R9NXR6_9BACT|nr:hypothetical protein [Hymenobacter perfusus]RSK45815.1 hypothetical protein EI293_01170 [Hymenobacter perfusus]
MRLFIACSLALALGACSKADEVTPPAALLDREWFNTFQKTEAQYDVYTPTNSAVGWRYEGIRLNTDGTFLEHGLGPADAPETRPGTWEAAGSNTYRIQFTDAQRTGFVLEVKSVEDGRLVARRQ